MYYLKKASLLKSINPRCNNICQHGYCHAGAVIAHFHDGSNECRKMAAWRSISSGIHIIFDWNEPIWTPWSSRRKVAGIVSWTIRDWFRPDFGMNKYISNIVWCDI